MARQATADGIAVVCATPHIRDDHDVKIAELPARVAALRKELKAANVPVEIVVGGELAERAAQRLDAETLRNVSLAGGSSLLIEPAPGPLGQGLQLLAERLSSEGFGVIVAHPERHADEGFRRRLADLVRVGCLVQWTAAFVAHPDHGDIALELARDGLLHLLGSDAHSSHGGRPVHLSAAVARLAQTCPAQRVSWIAYEAPWALLRGEHPVPPW